MDNVNVLQNICNFIILIGGVCTAIVAISHFIGKPINFFKKYRKNETEKIVKEILPQQLEEHQKKIMVQLDEIITLNREQSKTLEEQEEAIMHLIQSERDNLRYHIMDIYQTYKKNKAFPIYIWEKLQETYNDYKTLDGNNYIDKYFNRMKKWKVIDSTEEEEEI